VFVRRLLEGGEDVILGNSQHLAELFLKAMSKTKMRLQKKNGGVNTPAGENDCGLHGSFATSDKEAGLQHPGTTRRVSPGAMQSNETNKAAVAEWQAHT